jgi:hypothetical protein
LLLERAAEMGYAPAQAEMFSMCTGHAQLVWAEKAASQLNRLGLAHLGFCLWRGLCCTQNVEKGIELLRVAAALEEPRAMFRLGELAYGELDWERWYWWGRASLRQSDGYKFCNGILGLLGSFEKGEHGRILHTATSALRQSLGVAETVVFGCSYAEEVIERLFRVVKLHDVMLERARRALCCWSVVAMRLGVVRDIRIKIAKMAWEEVWLWHCREEKSRTIASAE